MPGAQGSWPTPHAFTTHLPLGIDQTSLGDLEGWGDGDSYLYLKVRVTSPQECPMEPGAHALPTLAGRRRACLHGVPVLTQQRAEGPGQLGVSVLAPDDLCLLLVPAMPTALAWCHSSVSQQGAGLPLHKQGLHCDITSELALHPQGPQEPCEIATLATSTPGTR